MPFMQVQGFSNALYPIQIKHIINSKNIYNHA